MANNIIIYKKNVRGEKAEVARDLVCYKQKKTLGRVVAKNILTRKTYCRILCLFQTVFLVQCVCAVLLPVYTTNKPRNVAFLMLNIDCRIIRVLMYQLQRSVYKTSHCKIGNKKPFIKHRAKTK